MLFLMLAAVLFALLVGALAFVTGPVGLTMAAVIGVWLLLYAGRGILHRRSDGGRRSGGAVGSAGSLGSAGSAGAAGAVGSAASAGSAGSLGRAADSSTRQPSATRRPAQRTSEVVHHV